ncbi:glutamyl-tRNA reductase [Moraxella nasovis]|uniref:glutamyl-tRNA reductase n=1 Tax=Moraxella nasovis TaxID=2904121 RepID=UPI001F5FF808|nr:glutamyl-tRNA reductase [Moraxella nasovis]UNU72719.1 glutamyl-tRNA reductase [Moraxella nasovis]
MKLAVIGINHKTAPVSLREKLSFGADMPKAIKQLSSISDGCAIVSTCNRSELYFGIGSDVASENDKLSDDLIYASQIHQVLVWFAQSKGVNLDDIKPYLYIYESVRALNHWVRVAAGLDSMILGEPQILGQIRQAVALSREYGGISPDFGWLTQRVFAAARTIRRDTKVGQQAVTLGFATAKLVTQIFDEPKSLTLMLVAAGEMNRLVAHNVATLGMGRIIIANRSEQRAKNLAEELLKMASQAGRACEISVIGLSELGSHLCEADVVSSCSGSMDTLITLEMAKYALKVRRNKPMLMVDLAVPRDIAPAVGSLDDVYLYSVDDLQHVIAGNLQERKQAAVEAEILASQLVAGIEQQLQVQLARNQIIAYRQIAKAHQARLLTKAMSKIDGGENITDVLEQFAHELTQALTHAPSKMIRDLALQNDPNSLELVTTSLNEAYRNKPSI